MPFILLLVDFTPRKTSDIRPETLDKKQILNLDLKSQVSSLKSISGASLGGEELQFIYDDLHRKFKELEPKQDEAGRPYILDPVRLAAMQKNVKRGPNGEWIPGESDIYYLFIPVDDPEIYSFLKTVVGEIKEALPEGADYYEIPSKAYHVSVFVVQDLRPEDVQAGRDEMRLTPGELAKSEKLVEGKVQRVNSYAVKLVGIRFTTDGGVIAVFEDNGETVSLRSKLTDANAKITKKGSKRPRRLIHVTFLRLLEDISSETLKKLKILNDKYKTIAPDLPGGDLVQSVTEMQYAREIGLMQSKLEEGSVRHLALIPDYSSFEEALEAFKKDRIRWKRAKPYYRQFLEILAVSLKKSPGKLSTKDLGKQISEFENKSLSGLRGYIMRTNNLTSAEAVKKLKRDLGIPVLYSIATEKEEIIEDVDDQTTGESLGQALESDVSSINRLSHYINENNVINKSSIKHMIRTGENESGHRVYLRVYREDNKVVGYILGVDMGHRFGTDALQIYIKHVVVDENYRNRGIRGELLDGLLEEAKRDGYNYFSTYPLDQFLVRILLKRGFKDMPERFSYILDLSTGASLGAEKPYQVSRIKYGEKEKAQDTKASVILRSLSDEESQQEILRGVYPEILRSAQDDNVVSRFTKNASRVVAASLGTREALPPDGASMPGRREPSVPAEEYAYVKDTLSNLKKPTNVFMSFKDYQVLSKKQVDELFGLAALNSKQLTVVIYGADSWEKPLGNIFITPDDALASLSLAPELDNNIQLSKIDDKVMADMASVRDKTKFFKYLDDRGGLLGVALLLSQEEDKAFFIAKYDLKEQGGFFVTISESLDSIIQAFERHMAVAIAA